MATAAFEELVEDFEFLDDWEDRYALVIDKGKAMDPLEEAFQVPATKVEGCASQVWILPEITDGVFYFRGTSDAVIVRGIIAVLAALYNGVPVAEVPGIDAKAELARLSLEENLSAQRSNGLAAMIARIKKLALEAA